MRPYFSFIKNKQEQHINLEARLSLSQSPLSSTDLDSPTVEERKDKEREKDDHEPVPTRSADVSLRKALPTISVRPRQLLALFLLSNRGHRTTDFHVFLLVRSRLWENFIIDI